MEFNYMKYANETGYRQRQKIVKLHQTEGLDLQFSNKISKNCTYPISVIYTRYVFLTEISKDTVKKGIPGVL